MASRRIKQRAAWLEMLTAFSLIPRPSLEDGSEVSYESLISSHVSTTATTNPDIGYTPCVSGY
jgi:hypothetical protein